MPAERLPFFLPDRLITLEYLTGSGKDEEYCRLAEPYNRQVEFAFFAANFGYSKAEYEALTPCEVFFLLKAWENREVLSATLKYNASYVSACNAMRKKGKPAMKLWRKSSTKRGSSEEAAESFAIVQKIDVKEGKNWVDKIYRANRRAMPKREVNHA